MTKPVILTGLRANNDLTLGNYFGAIKPIVDMAKHRSADYQINMFIPDLHSFTTPIDHNKLYEQTLHNARVFAAAGLPLDDENIFMYRQSFVPAHSELTWILDCFTGFGQMERMTQFKEKSSITSRDIGIMFKFLLDNGQPVTASYTKRPGDTLITKNDGTKFVVRQDPESAEATYSVSVGLFNYPVLMAADILLYSAQYIPVGDDQTQHLEFARDIAERMNSRFGDIFTVPEPVAKQHQFFGNDQGLRIMDLQQPTKKMSKSDESGKGVIFLNDDPAVAAKKIMSAATDDKASIHYDQTEQPGITNLLEILALLTGRDQAHVNAEWEGKERYGEFKQVVAQEVENFLHSFQQAMSNVDMAAVEQTLDKSEHAMNVQANQTLLRTQKAVGLRR